MVEVVVLVVQVVVLVLVVVLVVLVVVLVVVVVVVLVVVVVVLVAVVVKQRESRTSPLHMLYDSNKMDRRKDNEDLQCPCMSDYFWLLRILLSNK